MSHEQYLTRALRLAKQGQYTTPPNPNVGCVIVKAGRVIGEGYHHAAGQPHAEIMALNDARARECDTTGATAYVTLEPCNHHGKTPPCSMALVHAGITEVVIGSQDPNPQAAGGKEFLADHGLEVIQIDTLANEITQLNQGFIKKMQTQMPWVTLKIAMSLDGRIALANGESQWITGPEARADAQLLRARMSAIIIGSGTVLVDNPRYTVRSSKTLGEQPRQPMRVIIDYRARLTPDLAIFQTGGDILLVTHHSHIETLQAQFEQAQLATRVEIIEVPAAKETDIPDAKPRQGDKSQHPKADLQQLLSLLATNYHCHDVLLEAGGKLSGAFIEQNLVDTLVVYQAPTLLGNLAKAGFYLSLEKLADQYYLQIEDQRRIGRDTRFVAKIDHSRMQNSHCH